VSAYMRCGLLGDTAISMRPICVGAGGVVWPSGGSPMPLPVPAGQPVLSSAQSPIAGQPDAGIFDNTYTPFEPRLARSGCTGVAPPRGAIATYKRVEPSPLLTGIKPVTSWRCAVALAALFGSAYWLV